MPNYHLSIKIFSRGSGASALEKAAYRAGEKLLDDHNGKLYDYTRKGGVIHTEIMLPDHAPREYAERSTLWNAVERSEKNDNAQLAREIEISLPVELTVEQNIALAREYAQKIFVSAGMCADVCVHDTGKGNPHAHIMLTLRPIDERGRWAAKSRKEYILDEHGERIRLPSGEYKSRKINAVDWNDKSKAEDWRASWADYQNAALERHGFSVQVDHRSFERQGIDKKPTVHLGPAAAQMERKGIRTDRGNINRAVEDIYNKYTQIKNPKERDAYYAKHEKDIEAFKQSRDYINGVLNGKVDAPPVKDWNAELERLTSERYVLCDEYYHLDDELKSVEALQRGAEKIMREDTERDLPARRRDIAL